MAKFGILGAGTWGVALANMLVSMNHIVTCWGYKKEEVYSLNKTHKHPQLACPISPVIYFTNDLKEAIIEQEYVIFAVPSNAFRTIAEQAKEYINKDQIFISVSKGIEEKSLLTMSEILQDVLGKDIKVIALSGPTHAEEVAIGLPTLIVAASENIKVAEQVQNEISNSVLRVYVNRDIKGVEIAGAIKNVFALAAGMSDGMGFGDNAKAAIITRGLTELSRLATKMNCTPETFFGLTGIGDIVVTATSKFSRNHNAGVLLAKGYSLEETNKQIGMVIEGVNALKAAKELAEKYQVEMPIVYAVYDVVYGGVDPKIAVSQLFSRKIGHE